jgi:hypothetical protein
MPFTREDDLRLSIRMGLARGLRRLVRGMRRQLDEDDRNRFAESIRVALTGWPGPGIGGHSQLWSKGADRERF